MSLSAALAGLMLGAACVRKVPQTGRCLFNDECEGSLICAGGVCRAQCQTDRDCNTNFGERCGASDQPAKRVCLPPDAQPLCVYPSDCAEGLVCGAGLCVAQCRADYDCQVRTLDSTTRCVSGVCSDYAAWLGSRDAGAGEGGGDR